MNIFSTKLNISRKNRRRFMAAVLLTLIHNFIIAPVQASAAPIDSSKEIIDRPTRLTVMKAPGSPTQLLEQLVAADSLPSKKETLPREAAAFKLIETKPVKTPAFKGSSSTASTLKPISVPVPAGARTMVVTMTAYNSEPAQTDGDPCTTANGFNVCNHGIEDTVAANFLPMGTKIKIPGYFGDRVFTVRDRTSRKYGDRVDVWMLSKRDALQFGKRRLEIVIVN